MKKTLTVNLNNTVYHIDEDAYSQLQDYLESLNDYFRNEEGASEILSDIEARIAELFKERMRFGMQIITVREVDEIISVMGHPEDFASDTLNIETDDKEVGEKEVDLKSATKLFSVLLASKRPLITELADKLRLKYPLLPTISPCPTMRLEAIRSIIPISCRRYPKSV